MDYYYYYYYYSYYSMDTDGYTAVILVSLENRLRRLDSRL